MHWTKLGFAGAIAVAVASASPPALADDNAPLGERLVDVMNQLFGQHPGLRPMHAKGVMAEGAFTPNRAWFETGSHGKLGWCCWNV